MSNHHHEPITPESFASIPSERVVSSPILSSSLQNEYQSTASKEHQPEETKPETLQKQRQQIDDARSLLDTIRTADAMPGTDENSKQQSRQAKDAMLTRLVLLIQQKANPAIGSNALGLATEILKDHATDPENYQPIIALAKFKGLPLRQFLTLIEQCHGTQPDGTAISAIQPLIRQLVSEISAQNRLDELVASQSEQKTTSGELKDAYLTALMDAFSNRGEYLSVARLVELASNPGSRRWLSGSFAKLLAVQNGMDKLRQQLVESSDDVIAIDTWIMLNQIEEAERVGIATKQLPALAKTFHSLIPIAFKQQHQEFVEQFTQQLTETLTRAKENLDGNNPEAVDHWQSTLVALGRDSIKQGQQYANTFLPKLIAVDTTWLDHALPARDVEAYPPPPSPPRKERYGYTSTQTFADEARDEEQLRQRYTWSTAGATLLHLAIGYRNEVAARLLVQAQPDLLLSADAQGRTPLDYAATFRSEIFSHMLSDGLLPVSVADPITGNTILHNFASDPNTSVEAIQTALSELTRINRADILNVRNDQNITALGLAIQGKHWETMNLLLESGAKITGRELQPLIESSSTEQLIDILEAAELVPSEKTLLLNRAILKGNQDLISYLLNKQQINVDLPVTWKDLEFSDELKTQGPYSYYRDLQTPLSSEKYSIVGWMILELEVGIIHRFNKETQLPQADSYSPKNYTDRDFQQQCAYLRQLVNRSADTEHHALSYLELLSNLAIHRWGKNSADAPKSQMRQIGQRLRMVRDILHLSNNDSWSAARAMMKNRLDKWDPWVASLTDTQKKAVIDWGEHIVDHRPFFTEEEPPY